MVVAPETVDGGKGSVVLRDDGLIHLQWSPGIKIEVEDARAAMAKVNEVCRGAPHPMLVDMAAVASVSREARSIWSIPCDAASSSMASTRRVFVMTRAAFLAAQAPMLT